MTTLDLLRRIEWEGDSHHFQCPYCREHKVKGHAEDCLLVVALTTEDAKQRANRAGWEAVMADLSPCAVYGRV